MSLGKWVLGWRPRMVDKCFYHVDPSSNGRGPRYAPCLLQILPECAFFWIVIGLEADRVVRKLVLEAPDDFRSSTLSKSA